MVETENEKILVARPQPMPAELRERFFADMAQASSTAGDMRALLKQYVPEYRCDVAQNTEES